MGEVIIGDFVTRLDVPGERVLSQAQEAGLTSVLVLGYGPEGEEYMASSFAGGHDVVWLMERCKWRLMEAMEDE